MSILGESDFVEGEWKTIIAAKLPDKTKIELDPETPFTEHANRFGREGWELVAYAPSINMITKSKGGQNTANVTTWSFLFKRPVA